MSGADAGIEQAAETSWFETAAAVSIHGGFIYVGQEHHASGTAQLGLQVIAGGLTVTLALDDDALSELRDAIGEVLL